VKDTFMLDTNICSFIIRERPQTVLDRLQEAVESRCRIVLSAITYAELVYGANSRKASPKLVDIVQAFVDRVDEVLPWDRHAVDETARIKKTIRRLPVTQSP
jgi:tRNA(fMet)-specific endonuclease VapC